ncbi:hypothetical protein GCM10020000_06130 [Streptomyces olivoverticillatus]
MVSGNVRPVAEVKLGVFGLDRHIRWESGAYGEDAEERAELVRIALERASLSASDAVLVDDTPAGVGAALANGVRAVGVATGRSTAADLVAAGAETVLIDLADTDRVVSALS